MKNNKTLKGVLIVLLTVIMVLALVQAAAAGTTDFPLRALNDDLVADSNTQYIAQFSQDPSTKIITAEIKIRNGSSGSSAEPLIINGLALSISFDNRIAPCTVRGNQYIGALNMSDSFFRDYCEFLIKGDKNSAFNVVGSNAIRNDALGKFVGASVASSSDDCILNIAPGATLTIANFFFVPKNGTDMLDIDMFNFEFFNNSNAEGLRLTRLSTWLGNGSYFLYADDRASSNGETYVVNPQSFKLHVARPQPNVYANNSSRLIDGYDINTMEWSNSATSGYNSTVPSGGFGNDARTVYVRSKGSNYSGNDATYGNYKMYLASEPVEVNFSAVGATTYTVTFRGNGGTPDNDTREVQAGSSVGSDRMPTVTRNGFIFKGWNSAADNSGKVFTASTPVTEDIRVYAQWEPDSTNVKVTFHVNGGDGGNEEISIAKGSSMGANMPADPKRNGYVFKGWNTSINGNNSWFNDLTIVNDNITVYAQWEPYVGPTVKITFMGNGGTPTEQTRTIAQGGAIGDTNRPITPTLAEHIFMGWFDDPVRDDAKEYLFNEVVNSDKTVYARWTLITGLIVTFDYNYSGAPNPVPVQVRPGKSLDDEYAWPSDPERPGWKFVGWYERADGAGTSFVSSTKINASIRLYAKWVQDGVPGGVTGTEWIVIFIGNGGEPGRRTVPINETDAKNGLLNKMPGDPMRSGYTFAGWNSSANGAGSWFIANTPIIKQETTVHAIWEPVIDGPTTTIIEEGAPLAGFLADRIPYISGYPDGTVKPENPITRAETAVIFFRLLSSPEKNIQRETAFSDIPSDTWYTQAVNYLASINILLGYAEDGTFRPSRPISRAEFAAIASRFDRLEDVNVNIFPDVEGHWAAPQINSAYAKGWVTGYPEGTFLPQKNISRAEVVKIVNTMLNRKLDLADLPADIAVNIKKFSDIEGHWAHAYVVEASNNHDFTRKSDGFELWTALKPD